MSIDRCSQCFKNRFVIQEFCLECTIDYVKINTPGGREKLCNDCNQMKKLTIYNKCVECTIKYCNERCYECGSIAHKTNECDKIKQIPICPDCKQIRELFEEKRCILCWENILKGRCKLCGELGHDQRSCRKKKEFSDYTNMNGTHEEKLLQINNLPPTLKKYQLTYFDYKWIVSDNEKNIFETPNISELWKFYFNSFY
jgi:hypothetical protein